LKHIHMDHSILNKYYSILFKLPRFETMLVALIAVLTLLFLVNYVLFYVLSLHLLIVFTIIYIYSKLTMSVLNNVKRYLALLLTVSIYTSITSILFNVEVGVLSSTALLIIVLQGLDGTRMYRYLISVTPSILTLAIVKYSVINIIMLSRYLIVLLVLVLWDVLIYIYLSKFRIDGFKAPDIGTMFLWNWLDRRRDIEYLFTSIGEEAVVNPVILLNNQCAIIYSDIHYGPFSNIGSSMLPRRLRSILLEKGYQPIILHGFCSHERNLVSQEFVDKYINDIVNHLENGRDKLLYHGAFNLFDEKYKWMITGLVFDKLSIIIVSRLHYGIDDLPYTLQLEYGEKSAKLGVGDVILVDAHNWELVKELDLNSLRNTLDQAIFKIMELKRRNPVDVKSRALCINQFAPGVIDGVICGLEIVGSDGRDPVLIIYMHGNNIEAGLRDKIIEVVKGYFRNHFTEVLTNDEHSETGTIPYKPYIPVENSGELFIAIRSLIEQLQGKPLETGLCMVKYSSTYKILGRSMYKLIDLLEKTYYRAFVLIMSFILGAPFVTYGLLYLIHCLKNIGYGG